MTFHWDNQEVKGGYDHDGERIKYKRLREAEYAPAAEAEPGLPVLGKCTACDRPAVHKWPKGGVLICTKHWNKALAYRAQDMGEHPENYKGDAGEGRRPRKGQGGTKGYGQSGDRNYERLTGR